MGPKYNDPLFGLMDFFDQMFGDPEDFFRNFSLCNCEHLFSEGVFAGFPPVNIFVEKDKTLNFEFAVAGYNENDINLDFDGNYMELVIKKKTPNRDDVKILRRGIRSSDVRSKYYVPADKYDYANTEAELKNGMLKVSVPSKEPKEAHKITIKKA